MEVADALAAKDRTEREIQAVLSKFMEDTGLSVSRVELSLVDVTRMGERQRRLVAEVTLDVRL